MAKEFKKNKYDWSIVLKMAEKYPSGEVIGRCVGLDYVDLFSSLFSKKENGILVKILRMLDDVDLISCSQVSNRWRRTIFLDSEVQNRYEGARKKRAVHTQRRPRLVTANSVTISVDQKPLSTLQIQGTTNVRSSFSRPLYRAGSMVSIVKSQSQRRAEQHTHFTQYVEAARGLKQDECLCPCIRCDYPAKCKLNSNRAKCTRPSCQFDFCKKCRVVFHDMTPCRVVIPGESESCVMASKSSSKYLPGSALSKRNVKRL